MKGTKVLNPFKMSFLDDMLMQSMVAAGAFLVSLMIEGGCDPSLRWVSVHSPRVRMADRLSIPLVSAQPRRDATGSYNMQRFIKCKRAIAAQRERMEDKVIAAVQLIS